MKKLLIGSFLTAAIVIAGSTNANAQSKTETEKKIIKREVVKKGNKKEKVVATKKLNTTSTKIMDKKVTPKAHKVVTKEVAKEQIKRQPAKLNKKKK